ncbi:MAG: hypothetical protein B6U86_02675 [Candidatus Altiarchaeales archaeon ex4484_43]|nr:MAG: hypothetical protein B6U86_02675 [Candidatus Altiarchaeales archaeon ex4484_43]
MDFKSANKGNNSIKDTGIGRDVKERETKGDKEKRGEEVVKEVRDNGDEYATELDSYNISLDELSLEVKILDVGDYVAHYRVVLPDIDFVTLALLDETKRSLVGDIQLETQNILSPDRFQELKRRFLERSKEK